MKKYMNPVLIYAVLAMVGGVFYREFTKYNGFTGKTTLSVVHTHYFALGMLFFLMLVILEKNFSFTNEKNLTDTVHLSFGAKRSGGDVYLAGNNSGITD